MTSEKFNKDLPASERKYFSHSKSYYAKPFEKNKRCYLFPKGMSDAVSSSVQKSIEKRGFGKSNILRDWQNIVGSSLAEKCTPVKLTRHNSKYGGKLYVRVSTASALELQYQEPIILERLTVYYGYKVAEKMIILQ